MSIRSAGIVRRTDTPTDTHTEDVKTITPITSETWVVIDPVPLKAMCVFLSIHVKGTNATGAEDLFAFEESAILFFRPPVVPLMTNYWRTPRG